MIGWNWDCDVHSSNDCLRLFVALLGFMTTTKSSSAVLPLLIASQASDMASQLGLDKDDVGSSKEMAEKVLGELGSLPEVAAESVPSYGPCCRDDLRGRMMRALASMGKKEVDSIIEEQGQVEMTCEFCKESIVFKEDDLSADRKSVV